jgi:hypothetical protein
VDRANEHLGQGYGPPPYRSVVENGLAKPLLALRLQNAKQGHYLLAHRHQPDSVQITHRYLIIPQFQSKCQWASHAITGVDLTKL